MDIDALRAQLHLWSKRREDAQRALHEADGAIQALTGVLEAETSYLAATGTEDVRIVSFPIQGGVDEDD